MNDKMFDVLGMPDGPWNSKWGFSMEEEEVMQVDFEIGADRIGKKRISVIFTNAEGLETWNDDSEVTEERAKKGIQWLLTHGFIRTGGKAGTISGSSFQREKLSTKEGK